MNTYRRTAKDVKAAHVLHARLFKVSGMDGLLKPAIALVEAMKELGFLQDHDVRGKVVSYGNFSWKRNEPWEDAEVLTRLWKLGDALDVAEELIPGLKDAIAEFETNLA